MRVGTPASVPSFDWNDPATWPSALDGVGSVYVDYYPDLAVPGAMEAARSFAERAEQAVHDTGADLTILRSTWFMQNFSEDYMLPTCSAASSGSRPVTCRRRSWTPTTSPTWRSPP